MGNRWWARALLAWCAALSLVSGRAARAYDVEAVVQGGAIVGVVRYTGPPVAPIARPVTRDRDACGAAAKPAQDLITDAQGGLQDAVVWLDGVKRGKPFPALTATLDQRGCDYAPHVVLVPAGGTLEIRNPDGILHNVRTTSTTNPPINRAQPKAKTVMTERFRSPEIIALACDVHPWMRGWLVVEAHPYYAVSDAAGRFALPDVPPGNYTLRLWHERLGELTQPVTVRLGATTEVRLDLPPG